MRSFDERKMYYLITDLSDAWIAKHKLVRQSGVPAGMLAKQIVEDCPDIENRLIRVSKGKSKNYALDFHYFHDLIEYHKLDRKFFQEKKLGINKKEWTCQEYSFGTKGKKNGASENDQASDADGGQEAHGTENDAGGSGAKESGGLGDEGTDNTTSGGNDSTQEPGWDANGSPVDNNVYPDENKSGTHCYECSKEFLKIYPICGYVEEDDGTDYPLCEECVGLYDQSKYLGVKSASKKHQSAQTPHISPQTYEQVSALLRPNSEGLVSGKALHSLDEKRQGYQFDRWSAKMVLEFGISADSKILLTTPGSVGRPESDYLYTMNAAKMISMTMTGQVGKWARDYFLECERIAKAKPKNSPIDTVRVLLESITHLDTRVQDLESGIKKLPGKEDVRQEFNDIIKAKAKHSDLPSHLINYDGLAKRLNYAINELVLRDAYDKLDHPRGYWVYLDKNGDPRPNESFEKDGIGETELMFLHSIDIVGMTDANYIANSRLVTNSEGRMRRFFIKRDVADNDPKTWERTIQIYHDAKVNPLKPKTCKPW